MKNNLLLEKYRQFSFPAKASFWYVFSNVLLKGISFITLPIFSRLLSPSEYGVVSIYHSWVTILSIFCTLTLWGGIFNISFVKFPNARDKYVSSFQGLAITITVIFFLITTSLRKSFTSFTTLSPFLTICLYLDILASIPFNLWAGKKRFEYKYKSLVIITIVLSILNPLFGYVAVIKFPDFKAEARVVVGVILNFLLGFYLLLVNLHKSKTFINIDIWKKAILFNVPLIPHYLSMQVLSQSDRLMINKLCNSSDAGIYSIAYTFAMLLSLVTNGINSSFTPYIYQKLKNCEYEKLRKSTNLILIGIAAITIFVICIIPDIFRIMLPESYYPAIWVIPPVAGAVFFMFLYPLFGSVEFYYEAKKYVTMASVFGAILNIILNFTFIKLFGFIAAAYTTVLCYILFSIFHFFAMKRVLKKMKCDNQIYDIKYILILSVILLGLIIGITLTYNNSLIRWGLITFVMIFLVLIRKKLRLMVKDLGRKEA